MDGVATGPVANVWVFRVIRALLDGLRRVLTAPALLAGIYFIILLATIPMGFVLHESIASHLGASVVGDALADGVADGWWDEFAAQSSGLERTFAPSVIGFAAVLSNLSAIADGTPPQGAIAALVVVYMLAWVFLVGGVIDRLARQRRVTSAGFFSACGIYFFRFSRLAVLAGLAYWALFGVVHGWLFTDFYSTVIRDITTERDAFLLRAVFYAIFGSLLLIVNLIVDYAKIRAVVEDRRSMIGALLASVRFIRRRPVATVSLYLLNGTVFVLVLAGYALLAPGVGTAGPEMWAGFLAGQVYVIARLVTKLLFYASQISYFQSELAHANYVAAPQPRWPESPAAETIGGVTS